MLWSGVGDHPPDTTVSRGIGGYRVDDRPSVVAELEPAFEPAIVPAARRSGLGVWLVVVSALIPLAPILIFSHPALSDYQNHLARLWLLTHGAPTPFYSVDWRHITGDMGVDLVAWSLGPVASTQVIGRICLAAAFLLPPLGAVVLNRRLFGGWGPYQAIIPFFAWTLTGLAGFLNFQIGLGLALMFAAMDPALQSRGPWLGAAARCVCGAVLFFDHGLALLFYALLLAGSTFGETGLGAPGPASARRMGSAVLAALTCLIPVILVTLVSHIAPGNRQPPGPSSLYVWNTARSAMMAMASPLITYNLAADAGLAALAAASLAFAARVGRVRLHIGLLSVALVLLALSAFMPDSTPQGGWTDRRLPVMALFAGLAAVRMSFPGRRRAAAAFALAALALVGGRTAWIGWNWRAAQGLTDAVSTALASARPGARILPVQHQPTEAEFSAAPPGRFIFRHEPAYRHLAALAIPQRGAFVPTLFAQRGVHPIRVNPPWDQIAFVEGGDLASVNALANPALAPPSAPYVRLWRTRFDYVLVVNADYPDRNGPEVLPAGLTLVRDTGFAKLLRIDAAR